MAVVLAVTDEMTMMGVEGSMKEQSQMTLIMEVGFGVAFSFGPANPIVQTLLEQRDYLTAEHEMMMTEYFVLRELVCSSKIKQDYQETQKLCKHIHMYHDSCLIYNQKEYKIKCIPAVWAAPSQALFVPN